MKRFVVCDDNQKNAKFVGQLLSELYGGESVIKYISTAEALADLLSINFDTDVLLLDIELGPVNSIELVKKYLKSSSPLQIIYISGFIHYCSDVYDTRHISFLPKPVDRVKLKKAVDAALVAGRHLREDSFSVRTGGSVHFVTPYSLIYIESLARSIHLHTDNEELEVYEKLAKFCERLPNCFLRCHKSFAVNLQRVRKFCSDSFLMDNGQTVPISQTRRKEVRQEFYMYLEGKPLT